MNNAIEVDNLSFAYPRQDQILTGLAFALELGAFLAVVGPNGAGKSTLLSLLCRTLKANAGQIRIDGKQIATYSHQQLARKMAVVRQESTPVFSFTVAQTVAMARTPYCGTMGFPAKNDISRIEDALEITDTARLADRPMAALSGGERQRAYIARALAQDTDILLLDEPTSFLDPKHQVAIYDLLKTAQNSRQKTVVAVTHDVNLAIQYSDKALLLGGPDVHEYGPTSEVLTASRMEDIFGCRMHMGKVGSVNFFMPLGKHAAEAVSSENMPEKR